MEKMEIIKIDERGYFPAIIGIGLNKKILNPPYNMENENFLKKFQRIEERAKKLSKIDGGHNNFLEFIETWWIIKAPLFWWKQMDRYRMKSQQSESTMHTLLDKDIKKSDFACNISLEYIDYLNTMIQDINQLDGQEKQERFEDLVGSLPDGYFQRRCVKMNYKTIRNILGQRRKHKLSLWQDFCAFVADSVDHPEFLEK